MENKGEKPVKQLLRIFFGPVAVAMAIADKLLHLNRAAVATEPSGICQETC